MFHVEHAYRDARVVLGNAVGVAPCESDHHWARRTYPPNQSEPAATSCGPNRSLGDAGDLWPWISPLTAKLAVSERSSRRWASAHRAARCRNVHRTRAGSACGACGVILATQIKHRKINRLW